MASLTGSTLKVTHLEPALDQRRLFSRGMELVRELSSRYWTDHNTHDPGVTILELFSYALTELTYRATFPLEDLLAVPADDPRSPVNQCYTAGEILPNAPLTLLDYRKLLIDLPGVRNAWIHPEPLRYYADTVQRRLRHDDPGTPGIRPTDVRGLYRALIEYEDDIATEEQRRQVDDAAFKLLQANRNLCEDFVTVERVRTQYFNVCAEIELSPDGDPVEVAALLAFHVDQYLAPPIFNYSLAAMLEKRHEDGAPYTVDEIFCGPRLRNGFLDNAEVARADLRTDVRLSDVISLIMDLPGVLAVRDIVVNALHEQSDGSLKAVEPPNKWHVAVAAGRQSRLAVDRTRLVFYKRNLPLRADPAKLDVRLRSLRSEQRARFLAIGQEDVPVPVGRERNTGRFFSFQHDFPAVYGLSESGIPPVAEQERPERLARILQLKGYLLLFDQVMADYCVQLANVGSLFSRQFGDLDSYYSQVVELPGAGNPDLSHTALYPTPLPTGSDLASEAPTVAYDRRHRFLDHLLARVAEDFHHYVSIMQTAVGRADLLATKRAFLRDYPRLGAERGQSFDRTATDAGSLWNSEQVTGLERRLARLLGIGDISRRNLSTTSFDAATSIETTPDGAFRFQVKHRDGGAVLLESAADHATFEVAHEALVRAILRGQVSDGIVRQGVVEGRHAFHIADTDNTVLARPVEDFASESQMETAIGSLVSYLQATFSGEGMYVVENILLRPTEDGAPFLPICVDPHCSDCADDDPYSFRLQFLLPAYAGRFQNSDFRQFVEETIRQETPAHILPKVCWLDASEMERFESAYREWITLAADASSHDREQKRIAMQTALTEAKNVYPQRQLADCGDAEGTPPFILNQTRLGTA